MAALKPGMPDKAIAATMTKLTLSPRQSTFSRFTEQAKMFRQLVQPYYMSLDACSGYSFTWLLLCVIFIVTGITMVLITLIVTLLQGISPELADSIIKDEESFLGIMANMWHTPGGFVIYGLCFLGVFSFAVHRRQLCSGKWVGWALLSSVVLVLLIINILNTWIGFIARDLTNALVAKDKDKTYGILMAYASCFIVALPIRSFQFYFTSKLAILWRAWLSRHFIDSYMSNRAYYEINPNDEANTQVDNPDQRISEDTKTFTRETLSFAVGAFDALLTFVLNIAVLWSISHSLTLSLFAYSGTATLLLIVSSRNLVKINYNQLRYEADFRYGLVHIRNNAEAIAFYQGEEPEKQETQRRLGSVVKNFNYLIKWEVIISVLRRSYGYAGYFFPYLVMAPAYLAGELQYGSFVQAKFSFSMVESALSFVVSNIDQMAQWWAGISRLAGFASSMQDINAKGEALKKVEKDTLDDATQKIDIVVEGDVAAAPKKIKEEEPEAIVLKGIRVTTPGSEQVLVDDLSLSLGNGQRMLVVGPSGCGKTSVLRVASGLWRPEAGSIERPPVGKLLFVPQRPYMLLGSLREQLCYPQPQGAFDDEQLREALKKVRLPQLIDRYPDLDVKQDWPRLLSLGEQQRLAFARLLLNEPQFAVLDEATSALDVKTEQALYNMLVEKGVSIISVGHRPTLAAFHDQVLELQGQGQWRLIPAASYEFGAA